MKSTIHTVSCPDAVAAGMVCSHAVTVGQLHGWGIDCELVLDHFKVAGQARHKAVTAAWEAGHVRICTLDPASTGRPWLTRKQQSRESIADAMSFPVTGTAVAA